MNHDHSTTPLRSLAGTRRALVAAALATVTGWVTAPESDAKKKRKRKQKQKPATCGNAGGTPVKGQCCPGSINLDGFCRSCDVCANGCEFSTVQAAIDAASDGATVVICPGIYSQDLSITKSVRLSGAGNGPDSNATILRGTGATSVVKLRPANVVLQNLRITGGRGDGGGISNEGATLDVIGCVVTRNLDPNAGGGGIYNTGILNLTNSTVSDNEASGGGGIYNAGRNARVHLSNSAIRGNVASLAGGIYVFDGAELRLDAASRVTGNTARNAAGGIYAAQTAGKISLATSANVSGNEPTDCGGVPVDLCSGTSGPRG